MRSATPMFFFMSLPPHERGHDLDTPIDLGDYQADTAEAPHGRIIQIPHLFRGEVGGVRIIEGFEHSPHRPVDEGLGIHLFLVYVVLLDEAKHFEERAQNTLGFSLLVPRQDSGGKTQQNDDRGEECGDHDPQGALFKGFALFFHQLSPVVKVKNSSAFVNCTTLLTGNPVTATLVDEPLDYENAQTPVSGHGNLGTPTLPAPLSGCVDHLPPGP